MTPFRFPCLRSLFLFLVVVVIAFVGTSTADRVAPEDYCYRTVKGVPDWCAKEFIVAVYTSKNPSDSCCVLLACVHEESCVTELQRVCPVLDLDPSHPDLKCPPPA